MKNLCALIVAFVCISATTGDNLKCTHGPGDIPTRWIDMANPCIASMKLQVSIEIKASMTYLAMAAHFARDSVNRPGFSKHFFESASEERDHAIKIIEYLLMRGELTSDMSRLVGSSMVLTQSVREEWSSAVEALSDALELETNVTNNVKDLIKVCEAADNFNDYHLVDYLTTDFLDEQYKGQRDLAGKISTLGKMMKTHGPLGEFLYDKKMLNAEL